MEWPLAHTADASFVVWGIDYAHHVGDYVRNKAHTETGEIVAIDRGYAWVRVTDKKRVSILLSDLEPAPKPLQVGDRVKDPDGFIAQPGVIALIQGIEACVNYGGTVGLVIEDLERLLRA